MPIPAGMLSALATFISSILVLVIADQIIKYIDKSRENHYMENLRMVPFEENNKHKYKHR